MARAVGTGLTYDTGALLAAERGAPNLLALHASALRRDVQPTVPAVVVAQAWRGSARQARLARVLAGCVYESFDDHLAHRVGVALAASGTSDVVDAAVVIGALDRGDVIVTSDPTDLTKIADALGRRVSLHHV
jgi:hypothetical protein